MLQDEVTSLTALKLRHQKVSISL